MNKKQAQADLAEKTAVLFHAASNALSSAEYLADEFKAGRKLASRLRCLQDQIEDLIRDEAEDVTACDIFGMVVALSEADIARRTSNEPSP